MEKEVDLKDKTLLFIDEGIFGELALKLAEEYKEVLYFSEWKNAFPGIPETYIFSEWEDGEQLDTFDGKPLRKIKHLFDHVNEADIICMPDIYRGDMAEFFRSLGKPVFNAFGGEEIETDKWGAKEYFKEIGMDVIPAKRIIGVDALREYLKKQKSKKWIKIGGGFRKYCETFSHTDWELTELKLDRLSYQWGPIKKIIEFIVEDDLSGDDVYEEGYDGFVISGEFPAKSISGCEIKGCSYAGKLFKYEDLSEGIRQINEQLIPFFKKVKYNGAFSDEIRTKGEKHYLTDPCCFSSDTEVLTDSGWKLFKDCIAADTFATLNIETKQIEYQYAEDYIFYEYKGKMIHISNKRKTFDSLVTPNHDILRTDRHKKGLFKERADSLTDKGYIPRSGFWKGQNVEYFELPEYHKEWDFINSQRSAVPYLVCKKTHHDTAVKIKMADWAEFLGWYLSEGSLSQGWTTTITQTKNIEQCKVVMDKMPFKYTYNGAGFRFSSVQLTAYFNQFGLCDKKFIPDYIKNATPQIIRKFLDAFNLGDGSIHKGNKIYFTTSKQLADDIQECIFKAGGVSTLRERQTKGTIAKVRGKEYIRNHNQWIVCEHAVQMEYWFETGSRKNLYINEVDYRGMVYCLTVPNGTLYVRRNGNPSWSGNCRAGNPPTAVCIEMYKKLGKIIWDVAHGIVPEVECHKEYGMQLLVGTYWGDDETSHQALFFPPEIRDNVKIKNCIKIDGQYYTLKMFENSGGVSLVAIGDSFEECKKKLEEIEPLLKFESKCVELADLDKAIEEFNKMVGKKK